MTVSLSSDTSDEAIRGKVLDAVKRRFKLTVTPESRPLNVYVLSAPTGPGAELHRHGAAEDGERIDFEGKGCTGLGSAKGITASGGTMTGFSRSLEPDLDRLMIDETNLQHSYDFKIGYYSSKDDLFRLMHERLGLLVTPSQRKVTVLAVRVAGNL